MSLPNWLLSIALATVFASLYFVRGKGAYWLLDPRGPAAVLVFLHACGFLVYYAMHDRYPALFGYDHEYIDGANIMLLSSEIAFFLGTCIPTKTVLGNLPDLALDSSVEKSFLWLLSAAVILTGWPSFYELLSGFDRLKDMRYGADQIYGTDISLIYAKFTNVSSIALPLLVLYLVALGTSQKNIVTPKVIFLVSYLMLPALFSGRRRDVLLILGGLFLARAFRWRRRPWLEVTVMTAMTVLLSTVIAQSRSGYSLSVEDRVSAVQFSKQGISGWADHLCTMYSGNALLTAAMTVFPRFLPYSYGTSYAQAAANVLSPAFLTGRYPYKPMAHQFREIYYDQVRGFGLDYAMVAEAYQNFSFIGPFFVFLLMGYVLSCTYKMGCKQRKTINPWLLVHTLALLSFLYGLRTDSNGFFKMIVYGTVAIVVLVMSARFMQRFSFGKAGLLRDRLRLS